MSISSPTSPNISGFLSFGWFDPLLTDSSFTIDDMLWVF